MRPYSMDLRERVVAALDEHEGSQRQIARRFRVSLSFVARLLRRRRQTGGLDPRPHGGGHPPALQEGDLQRLRELVRQQPDATLEELRQRLGASCSLKAIWRALKTLDLPPASRANPRSRRSAAPSSRRSPRSIPSVWSSSMRAEPRRR
jgi:transposase